MADLSISDIESGLKTHLAENPNLYQEKMVSMENELESKGIQVFNNVEDEMPLYKLAIADPGQPGNRATEAPKSNVVNFSNRKLAVKPAEVTLKFTNQEINALYNTHLNQIRRAGARGDSYTVPFEDVIMNAVVGKFMDRIMSTLAFNGSFNASGTTTAAIANGWQTILAADITSTLVPAARVFTGAAFTNSNAVAQFHGLNDLVTSQSPEYEMEQLNVYCSPDALKKYRTNYRSTFNSLPYNTEFKKNFLDDDTNRAIMPMQGLAGDDRIIITTPGNLVIGTDALNRLGNVWTEARGRDLYVYIDGKIGFNYIMDTEIWTNDQ